MRGRTGTTIRTLQFDLARENSPSYGPTCVSVNEWNHAFTRSPHFASQVQISNCLCWPMLTACTRWSNWSTHVGFHYIVVAERLISVPVLCAQRTTVPFRRLLITSAWAPWCSGKAVLNTTLPSVLSVIDSYLSRRWSYWDTDWFPHHYLSPLSKCKNEWDAYIIYKCTTIAQATLHQEQTSR